MGNLGTMPEAWRAHDARIRPYVWKHRIVGWTRSALGLFFVAVLVFTMRGRHLEWMLNGLAPGTFVLWLLYFGVLGISWEILSFPFSWAGHRIERSHGLSKQGFKSWLGDKLKGWALMAILGTIVMGLLYISQTWFGEYWWLAAATLFLLFSILLAQLAPILLIPLFFKLKPMEPSPLKERLLALCKRYGVEVKDVYHLGLGEKTEKGNAAFVGLGRTKRILIGDTLYEKYPVEQVEAVFAHELGHQVHNDLWKGIGFSSVTTYIAFFAAALITTTFLLARFETTVERPFGLLLFFIVLSVVQMPLGIFQSMFSRLRERMADGFAAEKIGVAKPLADSLERLTFQNWSYFRPNALLEFLSYSHPAPWRRITKLRG